MQEKVSERARALNKLFVTCHAKMCLWMYGWASGYVPRDAVFDMNFNFDIRVPLEAREERFNC